MSGITPSLGSIGPLRDLPQPKATETAEPGEGFGAVLTNALQQVNQLGGGAEQQIGSLL